MNFLQLREPFSAWSHGLGLLLSLPATIYLLRRCGPDRSKKVSFLIFGLGLASCYLGSMLYHGVRLRQEGIDFFDRMDHIGIHLLIAGSYTPVAWNLLRGAWRAGTLLAVWSTTVVSCVLIFVNIRLPVPLQTCEYLALGWGAMLCYVQIARIVPSRALRPLILGGVFYSVGAILNLLHWPVLWPGVFGSHEMFHVWVLAGSAAHFCFMLTAVIPFAYAARVESQVEAQAVPAWDDASRDRGRRRKSTGR